MDELAQQRAADHLDVYRYDGRSYDISEENGVLRLQLRRSVRWERSLIAALATVLLVMFFVVCAWMDWATWRKQGAFFVTAVLSPIQFGVIFAIKMNQGEVWTFDKSVAEVSCGPVKIAGFPKIRGVHAWKRGGRYYLALQLRYGQTQKLGRFAFSRSEGSWRQDAAQIAAFIGVPLEIPPL